MRPDAVVDLEESSHPWPNREPLLGLKVDYSCEVSVIARQASCSAPAGVDQQPVSAVFQRGKVLSVPLVVARVPGHPNIRFRSRAF